jgi:hypothetical protein
MIGMRKTYDESVVSLALYRDWRHILVSKNKLPQDLALFPLSIRDDVLEEQTPLRQSFQDFLDSVFLESNRVTRYSH